jgi:hypothetical protein
VARMMRPKKVPPPTVVVETSAEEAGILGEAIRQLRGERAAGRALATLEVYFDRFPRGQLWPEAQVTRLEALLALDRGQEAVKLLENWPAELWTQVPRAQELKVVQGELYAAQRRYTACAATFDSVLELASLEPVLTERALFGRAGCREHQGDAEGARKDLEEYLRRFPEGRFAAAAQGGLSR